MEKTIFEQMGGTYAQAGDYNLPSLILSNEESKPIGIWGQRHARYLKQNRKVLYMNLLTSGKLNAYLANIDKQAQERFERLIEGMKQTQGITEQLKAENALEWVGNSKAQVITALVINKIPWICHSAKKIITSNAPLP